MCTSVQRVQKCNLYVLLNYFLLHLFSLKGFNDNPTAQQFEAAYRKLIVHNDVICSKKANCIDMGTKILSVSSNRSAQSKKNDFVNNEFLDDHLPEDEDLLYQDFFDNCQYIDNVYDHSIAYMASVLEARIIGAKRGKKIVKCEQCVSAFIENELIDDSFIRFKSKDSNVLQPCKSTFEICKFVDSYMKSYTGNTIPYDTITLQILRKISFDSLFVGSDFENHAGDSGRISGHRYDFVKEIIGFYMRMMSVQNAKRLTLKTHDNPMRHTFKKLIQERGE